MKTPWPGSAPDMNFEALARQYWNAWGDAMRSATPGMAPPASPGWQQAIDWWSRMAQGGNADANAAVERFNAQARDWYGQMQQVAAQFAGHDADPADIAASWKRALAGLGENPFADMFRAMRGQGAQGIEQWTEAARPYLDAWRKESSSWLGLPTFGIGREQQQRWQQLAQAQSDYQQEDAAFNALLLKASQRAYAVFEDKLREHMAPGRQLTSARALFDLWIDAAEAAYAEVALSPEFRKAYGARVNAQMRLRQAAQGEMERTSALFGMPTRSDLDAAFRKITDLERALRALRDRVSSSAGDTPQPQPRESAPGSASGRRQQGRGAATPAPATASRSSAPASRHAAAAGRQSAAAAKTAAGVNPKSSAKAAKAAQASKDPKTTEAAKASKSTKPSHGSKGGRKR